LLSEHQISAFISCFNWFH